MSRHRVHFIAALLPIAIATYGSAGSAQVRTRPATPVQKPGAPPIAAPAPATPPPVATPTKPGAPVGAVNTGQIMQLSNTMPTIAYGTPQPRTLAQMDAIASVLAPAAGGKPEPRQLSAVVAGQNVVGRPLHLRGMKDIEQATELPEGVRRLLLIHVGKTAANESDHYIINPQLAQQWAATHEVPPGIQPPPKPSSGGKGCSTRHISMKCVQNEGEQLIDKASEEWERLRQQTEDVWNHAAGELSNAWNEVQGCFADKTLSLNEVPVQFSIAPTMTIPLGGAGMRTGTGSGQITGSVGLGFPMQADFSAKLDLFYIPCLPFAIRPKALSADGAMTVGETLTATVAATGEFGRTFKIPPAGGPTIPIVMIPIVIAGVPVAELDVSAYIDGSIEVTGQGRAEGSFEVNNTHTAQFDFACDGTGCRSRSHTVRAPATTTESAQLEGEVSVKPAVYTALQLNFNFNALSARAGPQPYLFATASGCIGVTAQQTEGGQSSTTQNAALTTDLDWGVEFRAEALIAGQVVGNPYVTSLVKDRHIWFRDLAPGGSTALVAVVDGASQITVAQAATYKVKMPSCYPYTDPVRYRVTWTGDATPAGGACQWQAGEGICNFDPAEELVFNLTWATPGIYSLTVAALRDQHREFEPRPEATQVEVTVAPGG